MKVHEQLRERARRRPDHPAVIEGQRVFTYGRLWDAIDALGEELTRVGVRPRQGIGVLAGNGAAMIAAALAVVARGAVAMPIHHDLAPDELNGLLRRTGLHAVIAPAELASRISHLDTRNLKLETRNSELGPWTFHRRGVDPRAPWVPHVPDAAFVRFTSGTTADAMGVVLSHRDVLERIELAQRGLCLDEDERVIWVLPMAFHFFVSILLYLDVGATIIVCSDRLSRAMLETVRAHEATFLYAAPIHYRMLAADRSGLATPSLRRAVSVSSGLDPQVARAFRWRYGLSVAQALGVIEVGLPLVNRIDPQGRPESVGAPTAGAEAAIVDGAGRPLPDGEVGELLLHAPGMLSAYLDPPLGREAILRDGWFQTGDLARRDADGLITLVGRRKSVLNVAGHKVFPEEVAAVLERHPAVVRAGVDSRPHPLIGEAVHARLQVVDVSCPPDLETLRAHCRPYLSAYKIPVSIEVVEELEVTSSGKVRHGSSVRNEV